MVHDSGPDKKGDVMARRNWQLSLSALLLAQVAGTGLMAQTLVGDGTVTCDVPYLVQPGDTLSRIAQRAYGISGLYDRLIDANSDLLRGNADLLAVGMEIAIPCLDAAGDLAEADMATAVAAEGPLSSAELDALFGPVALFPDPLITQILVAVTYPLDIVKAGRFVAESAALTAEERATAASEQDWDPTVRQLAAAFPDLVTRMNDHLDWTEQAGEAVLAQTDDVLDAIQRLRTKAMDNGYLTDTAAQNVEVTDNIVSIAPAEPGVVYVPVYETQVVYTTPLTTPPQYYYDYDDDYYDNDWDDALIGGAIFMGSAIILDEIFDDDDWDDIGDWDSEVGEIDWDNGEINIDRGDINIDRDNIEIGSGDRQVGDREINIGEGDVRIGNRDRPEVGDIRDGDRNPGANREDASRDAARERIETRQDTGRPTADLPTQRPNVNRPNSEARPNDVRRPSSNTRDTPVARPSSERRQVDRPTTRQPSRNDNAFAQPQRQQATREIDRGRNSTRNPGSRRR